MSQPRGDRTDERRSFFTPIRIGLISVGGVLVALLIAWLALNASARRLEEERASAKAELDELRSRIVPAVAAALIDVESPAAYVAHAAQDVYSLAHTA